MNESQITPARNLGVPGLFPVLFTHLQQLVDIQVHLDVLSIPMAMAFIPPFLVKYLEISHFIIF